MNRYLNIYFYSTINVIMYEATLVFVYQRKCTVLKFNYAFLKKMRSSENDLRNTFI